MPMRVVLLAVVTWSVAACSTAPHDPSLYRYGNTNAAALDAYLDVLYERTSGPRRGHAVGRTVIVVPEGVQSLRVDGRRYRVPAR